MLTVKSKWLRVVDYNSSTGRGLSPPGEETMATHTISTESDFARVLNNNETIVLDFWAKWCPPCKGFAPVFEAAANDNPDMAFCRVDTDEVKELKEAFEVKSIPTLVVIRDKILVASQPGYMDKTALANLLEKTRMLDMNELRENLKAEPN